MGQVAQRASVRLATTAPGASPSEKTLGEPAAFVAARCVSHMVATGFGGRVGLPLSHIETAWDCCHEGSCSLDTRGTVLTQAYAEAIRGLDGLQDDSWREVPVPSCSPHVCVEPPLAHVKYKDVEMYCFHD